MNRQCRLDGGPLIEVVDLGSPYVSNFVDTPGDGVRFPLRLGLGRDSGLLQLFDTYPPEEMYQEYWYLSGVNESMRESLRDVVRSAQRWVRLEPADVVLDIGSNDGTMLGMYPDGVERIGIDPAKNLAPLALANGADCVVPTFFSADVFHRVSRRKAKVITSIAIFYDIDDPVGWLSEVRECLAHDGIWICQMSYMPLMLKQNAFDNICHEHITYYSFQLMELLLARCGLQIVDVELNNVNGGSFRIYAKHEGAVLDAPIFESDIGQYRVSSLRQLESSLALESPSTYEAFARRVADLQGALIRLLCQIRDSGQTVLGYGASTKGNTLLQHYGITPELLPAIVERSPAKFGKYTVGSGIPIISEAEMRRMQPDYLLVLPWHFLPMFVQRERELLKAGMRFIVPLPAVQVIGLEGSVSASPEPRALARR